MGVGRGADGICGFGALDAVDLRFFAGGPFAYELVDVMGWVPRLFIVTMELFMYMLFLCSML